MDSPVQNPSFDSLGRSPEALPYWSRYSLPLRVMFPVANVRRDIAHGLGVIPSGYHVIWSDAPITAVAGLNWTPTIAYLQAPTANARAIIIFLVLRESVTLTTP